MASAAILRTNWSLTGVAHRTLTPSAMGVSSLRALAPRRSIPLDDHINPRYRAMVLLATRCGLRRSVAAGLTRDRINLCGRLYPRRLVGITCCRAVPGHPSKHGANIAMQWYRSP